MRIATLYILSFKLCKPREWRESAVINERYGSYDHIQNIPDRLCWLRCKMRLLQAEVAEQIGMSPYAYKSIEEGITHHVDKEMRERLAGFFGIPALDLLDEFNQFLEDGQGCRIRAWRSRTGLSRQAFAGRYGIPVRNLKAWEEGKSAVSYKNWEKYFKGRA